MRSLRNAHVRHFRNRPIRRQHYYYTCVKRHKKKCCDKKHELKDKLEKIIVEYVRRYILFGENAQHVVNLILKEYDRKINTATIKMLEAKIADIDRQLDEIVDLLLNKAKNAALTAKLTAKADELDKQKTHTETELAKIRLAVKIPHSRDDLLGYLKIFAKGDLEDIEYRRRIIDRLLNKIYVYDDKILVYFNILDDRHISFDTLPDLENAEIISENDVDCANLTVLSIHRGFFFHS